MSRETAVAEGAILDLAELGILAFSRVVGVGPPDAIARTVVPFEILAHRGRALDGLAPLNGYAAIVLTHPELGVLEALDEGAPVGRIVAFLPPVLDDERRASVRDNVPRSLDVTFLAPTEAPSGVSPARSAFLTVGFRAGGGYALVPWWTAEVLHTWRHRWFGRSLLFDPLGEPVRSRPPGWTSVPIADHFTAVVGAAAPTTSEKADQHPVFEWRRSA